MELLVLIGLSVLGLGLAGFFYFRKAGRPSLPKSADTSAASPSEEVAKERTSALEPPAIEPVGLVGGLSRTRNTLFGKIGGLLSKAPSEMNSSAWEELEEALLEGDVGIHTVTKIIDGAKSELKQSNGHSVRELIEQQSLSLLQGLEHSLPESAYDKRPFVISLVGVNGAGKTTTVGKLAQRYRESGKSVLIGAGDTFRAAAISQLRTWAERTDSQFVTGREGADPGAVAFDSVTAAKARNVDIVLLDSAGRLHTKSNLMDELTKVDRVVKKVIADAPHETWLVLDGTTGQNAVFQAKQFREALNLTGVVITKLDGTAKGGSLLSIVSELNLPIRFVGVGESAADLIPFEPRSFVEAILGK